jgi:adenine-specific DNA-methyltransferase
MPKQTDSRHLTPDHADIDNSFRQDASLVLYEGDALDLLKTIPEHTIGLVTTSPPYNLGKSYETQVAIEHYLEVQTRLIAELHRVLMDNGSICWQVGNFVKDKEVFPLDILYYPIFKKLGMRLRNRIIWHFGHGLHASKRFSGRYETILWFTKGDDYKFNLDSVRVPAKYPGKRHYKGPDKGKPSGNPNGKNPSDVWVFLSAEWEEGVWEVPNVKANHVEQTSHPCQFPVELAERCVLALTDEGDRVLDPYAGVGSTLIAAVKHRRQGIGSEKDPGYCQIARERLGALNAGTLRLRPMGKPIHEPNGREKVAMIPEEWLSVNRPG